MQASIPIIIFVLSYGIFIIHNWFSCFVVIFMIISVVYIVYSVVNVILWLLNVLTNTLWKEFELINLLRWLNVTIKCNGHLVLCWEQPICIAHNIIRMGNKWHFMFLMLPVTLTKIKISHPKNGQILIGRHLCNKHFKDFRCVTLSSTPPCI